MFSSRLEWTSPANSIDYVRQQLEREGRSYLDLSGSNPTRAGIRYPETHVIESFHSPGMLSYEPAAFGLPAARELVGRLENVELSRIVLTASTSEAYAWLFKLLADPGDEILSPIPSYPLFEYLARLESVQVRTYPLHYDHGWFIDVAALEAGITSRTRAIVVVNPNNPTGSYLKRQELLELVRICRKHSIAIISDQVFASYPHEEDPERVSTLTGVEDVLTFCLNGLSKWIGMPQMKLGWMVIGGPLAARREAMQNLELLADTYLSVGAPVQFALPGLLAIRHEIQSQILERVLTNKALLAPVLSQVPACSLLKTEGGWSAILRVPRIRSEEQWVIDLLQHYGVLVQPGYFYDFETEAYLVLSLLTPPVVFGEGIKRLARAINAN